MTRSELAGPPVRRRCPEPTQCCAPDALDRCERFLDQSVRDEQQRRGLRMRCVVRELEAGVRGPQAVMQRIDEVALPRDRPDMPAAAMQIDLEVARELVRRWRRARTRSVATPVGHGEAIVGVTPRDAITRLPLRRRTGRRFRQSRCLHVPTLQATALRGKHRMRVFLTSATGYVGAAVAARLQARGHTVAALARSTASAERLLAAAIRPVPGNLARAETYRDETERADAVVHTAFEYSADGAENVDLDMQATRTLLRARRLIYTSNAYRPRIAVERMLGPSAAAIRVGMVYGACGGGTIASLFAAAQYNAHLPYLRDAANNRWSLIYLGDLAALYERLVETKAAGVFNGCRRTTSQRASHAGARRCREWRFCIASR